MGADGSIQIVKREAWDTKFPSVSPREYGYYTGTILGVEAVWTYFGEPDYCSLPEHLADPRYPHGGEGNEKGKEILEWFEGNAEVHEVWT